MSELAPYPNLIQLQEYDGISGIFSYIIDDYGKDGICCRIDKVDDGSRIFIGDWSSNLLTPTTPLMNSFMQRLLPQLLSVFASLKLISVQFYFASVNGEFVLVDVLTGDNKYASPGMVEELFGKMFRTQNVVDKAKLTSELINTIRNGIGKYSGSLIIKPNRFRSIKVGKQTLPLYIRVTR